MTDKKPLLPHETDRLFLTDGGLETWLIFHRDVELNDFAAFELLNSATGKALLAEYYQRFLGIAGTSQCGFVLDTPTWRANSERGIKLGYSIEQITNINRQAVSFMRDLRADSPLPHRVPINGVIGPRGDGYQVDTVMQVDRAQRYHQLQVDAFASVDVDMVSAITMTNGMEAIGIALAAQQADVPCVISFTVETDGFLPNGQSLPDAIAEVDDRTAGSVAYYMINCAHPDHFSPALLAGDNWTQRLGGVRVNASRMSHEELDNAEVLDEGNATELGELCASLSRELPRLNVLGGCCGTDHRHVEHMAQARLMTATPVAARVDTQ